MGYGKMREGLKQIFAENKLLRDCTGVTAIEYGLIAGLISVALITVFTAIGTDLTNIFTKITDAI